MKRKEVLEGDYEFRSKRSFKRAELQHELGHESNNIQVVINGKAWKVLPGQGRADSREEYQHLQKMKAWAARKSAETGKKWEVYLTGASPSMRENVPPTGTQQPAKVQKINPDGTAEIVDNKGTVTKVNQKDIAPDSKDPNKLNVNVPKPKVQPGTNVNLTMEEIKKLAGL